MPAPEYQIITACVARIRRRLWLVRIMERASYALAWAAAVAILLVAARLFRDRFLWLAILMAALPFAIATTLWLRRQPARRQSQTKPLPSRIVTPPYFLNLLTILTILASVAAIILLALPSAAAVPIWLLPAIIVLSFTAIGAATLRPVDPRAAAIFIDQQVGLKERVATALEFIDQPPSSRMESSFRIPVIASAVEACQSMGTAKVRYARADQRLYAFAATATLAAAGICFLTPLPAAATPAQHRSIEVVEKAQKLDKLLSELEQKKIPENTVAEQKLQPLKEALTDLRKGNMSPFEADARLTQEKGDLQREQEQMDAAEKVAKALDNIKGLDDIAKASEKVKDANMKNASGDAGAAGNMQQANQNVKDAAKALGDKMKNGGMSDQDKQKLASDLKNAANQAKGDPQLKNNLDKAADAAQKGDGDQLSQSLADAGQRAGEQSAQQQLSGDAVRQAMDAIDRANNDGKSAGESQAQANSGQNGGEQNGDNSQQNGGQNGQQGGQQNQQGGQQGDGQQQANSGQNGDGQQSGGQQNSSGQGSQSGQGGQSQSAQGQGQGQATSESGSGGSTNLHAPSAPGDHDPGHPLGGTSEYVKVYDEKSINSQGKLEQVSGKINMLAPASGTAEVFGQGDKGDPTIKTYDSQLPTARKRALDDLQTQQIPPQYRDLIRNYYTQ